MMKSPTPKRRYVLALLLVVLLASLAMLILTCATG